MINFEILLGIGIFALGLYSLLRDYKFFIYLLLFSSVLIHKEMFSLYMWDFLPVRFLMLALTLYVGGTFLKHLLGVIKQKFNKDPTLQNGNQTTGLKVYLTDPFIVSLSVLWIVRGLSIFFSQDIRSSIELYGFFTSIYFASLFIYIRTKGTPSTVLKYLDFYVFVVFLLCVFGLIQLYLNSTYNITIGAFWKIPGHIPRVGSLFWDVNHFGAFISSLFLYGCARIFAVETIKQKVLYTLLVLPVPLLLFLSNSRSSMLLLLTASAVFAFLILFKKIGRKAFTLSFLLSLFGLLLMFVLYSNENSKISAVINRNLHYRIDSFDSHFLLLSGASEIFTENPILGGGYGSFYAQFLQTSISSEYLRRDPAGLLTKVPAHTIWGEVASETGIMGIAAFLFLCLIITFIPLYNLLTSQSFKEYFTHAAIVSSILGYFVAGIFYSYNSEFFWLVLVLYTSYSIGKMIKNTNPDQLGYSAHFSFNHLKRVILFVEDKFSIGFVLLAVLAFAMIFLNLGKNALITWDESIYGKISKNILLTGDWMSLQWDLGRNWFEKPPLYFWSTAFFMKAFGISEITVRLTSALSGFGSIIAVTYFAKRIFGRGVGYLAGFVLLTTFQFLYYARTGMLDVTLTFFITMSLITYYLKPKVLRTYLISGLFVGLAVMTKGIVGFLPLLVILIFELITRPKKEKIKSIITVFYIILFAAFVFVPWHFYMFGLHGEKFYDSYIVYHVLQRASTAIEDKGQPIWWYIIVMKVSMRLWFIALLVALPFTISAIVFRKKFEKFNILLSNSEVKGLIFILVWFFTIGLFFSLAVSKLIWYIIPIYVPTSIIISFGVIVLARAFTKKLFKNISDSLVFGMVFALLMTIFAYFYVEKGRVYTEDYNGNQAYVLKQANKKFPKSKLLVDRIDLPVVKYYREGPFVGVDLRHIKAAINSSNGKRVVFITNEGRFKELLETYPILSQVDLAGEFVLATYSEK